MSAILILLAYQISGEFIQELLIPMVPGPLIGLCLLFVSLLIYPDLYKLLISTCNQLFKHLMVIYIVFGAGLVNYESLLLSNSLKFISLVCACGVLSLAINALLIRKILK